MVVLHRRLSRSLVTLQKCYDKNVMTTEDKNLLAGQVQTDVSLLSILSVISVFFIGSLLPKFDSYDLSVKIPISFLIIATFAFIFAALIISNASQRIIKGDLKEAQRHLDVGYAISEYMGVFLFVLSVPLAISIITADPYLRIVTFCAAILGMSLYSFMGFSLLENHFSKSYRPLSIAIILFGIILFFAQIFAFQFTAIAVIFLVFILLTTIFAPIREIQ
jgi:hypothetical protein